MFVIRHLTQTAQTPKPLALSIGNFDGVHLGHLKIIEEIKKIAQEKKISSAILTFEPHPFAFFKGDKANNFRLQSLSQKLKIFRDCGINYAIILPFNQKTADVKAESFIEQILVQALNVKHLSVGYDFTFGKNREGNFELLNAASKKFNFELNQISAASKSGQIYSSSLIRRFISEGKITQANQFLGHHFTICGMVNEGRKLGRTIGFPTANLEIKPHIIKPKFGVYKTITSIPTLQKKFPSITNFGVKPTIGGGSSPLLETHIPNFDQNLYGKKIEVEFLDFIREEKKFESLESLKEQIKQDLLQAE